MNIYPVTRFRDALFESKYSSLQNQAAVVASSLSALSSLNVEDVEQVMDLLDNLSLTRIVITDQNARVVYDTSSAQGNVGRLALFSEITRAISGKNVFYSNYSDGVLISRSAIPVTYKGQTTGSVYIYDYDTEQAGFLVVMRNNLSRISIIMLIVSLIMAFLMSGVLTGRIRVILKSIRLLGEGNYNCKMKPKGHDELAELGNEFNVLVDRLQKTEAMRQRFVSDASHELKTPLAAIKLLTDSIIQNDNMDTATLREFISDIGSEADRLTRTTEKLLRISRLNNEPKKNVPTDVKIVVEKAAAMLRKIAEEKNVTLEVQTSDECVILADPDDIHQIVVNLTENAIKYNVPNGNVTVLLFNRDGLVTLLVNDTGIGIPADDLPYVFDRFYRVDKSRESEVGGSGLGLSIVKDMVVKYKGTVVASGREHGGTSFRVVFPAYTRRVNKQ